MKNEMDTYEKLTEYAARAGIMVLEEGKLTASIRMDGVCAVFIDSREYSSASKLAEALAHELGHCESCAFYSVDSARLNVRKCELLADLWSALTLLPPGRLRALIDAGARELHELSEATGRSEEFVRRAIELYRAKGLL